LGREIHDGGPDTKAVLIMLFRPTDVDGVLRIEAEPHRDERGMFARLYCPHEFERAGLGHFRPVQVNLSTNHKRGTLRGMHYQPRPHAEDKLVFAARGKVFDAVVDLRPESPTYLKWTGHELAAGSGTGLFIPEGCAHGFLTLEDQSDVLYQMGNVYQPGLGATVRWNDPAFGIDWPESPKVMSERDRDCPDYQGQAG
jgi:dTDP-4-dehydrorhamnose 3,5-epimerase